MKREALAALLIVIVVVGCGAWLFLNQNEEQKPANAENENNPSNETNQTSDVKITDFKWDGWGVPVGVTAAIGFNVTIRNEGTKNITGLTVEVKMLDANGSEVQTDIIIQESLGNAQYEYFDGILQAGGAPTLQVSVLTDFNTATGVWGRAQGLTTTIISVNLGNVVLDKLEIPH